MNATGKGPRVGKRWIILIAVGLAVGIVDQWTKFLAVKHLTPAIAQAGASGSTPMTETEIATQLEGMSTGEQISAFFGHLKHPCRTARARCRAVSVVDGFWNWRYVENPGAAWGIMSQSDEDVRIPFFLIVPIAAVIFIIAFVRKLEDDQYLSIAAMSLVFGGAIGNFIDRLHLSYVIDFIDWYVGKSHWPTFNFADAAISTGVGLLILEWLRDWQRARSGQTAEKATT
jgi:signal peptidase II